MLVAMILRWSPVGVPVVVFAATEVAKWPSILEDRRFFRLAVMMWVFCSLGVALTGGHRLLADRLRHFTPLRVAGIGAAVGIGAVLTFAGWIHPVWLIVVLAVTHICAASTRPGFAFALSLFWGFITLAPLEALLVIIRSSPAAARVPVLGNASRGLFQIDRNVVQWDPACSQFDPELSYTLRTGSCTFSNPEYTTHYQVNRLGLRDDEASLDGPEVVVLGDSYAMGWGVEQDQTFAQQLERMSGHKVLNAGISSYATARELLLLKRIDRHRMRCLILQYYINDLAENRTFLQNGYTLPRRTADWYSSGLKYNERRQKYYPGRYLRLVVADSLQQMAERLSPEQFEDKESRPGGVSSHAGVLLEVLEHTPVDLSAVQVIVLEASSVKEHPARLAPALRQLLAARQAKSRLGRVDVLEPADFLDENDQFPLDGHWNASGHGKVAQELLKRIFPAAGGLINSTNQHP